MASRPRPTIDVWNRPFWDACREHRLVAQRCNATGRFWFPPSPVSPHSGSADWQWAPLSGRGRVWSWVRMHQLYFDAWKDALPYTIVQIELDEGISMISNLVGIEDDAIRADLPVEVCFEDLGDGLLLPQFKARED